MQIFYTYANHNIQSLVRATSPEHIWRVLFRDCLLPWRSWPNLGRILKWLSCPSFKNRRCDMDASSCVFTELVAKGRKKAPLQNYALLTQCEALWFCFKMSVEHEISLSDSNTNKKRIKKRLRFRELEVGAVQLSGSYVLFLRNPYLFLLQRKLKNRLYLMNRKCRDGFYTKLQDLLSFWHTSHSR